MKLLYVIAAGLVLSPVLGSCSIIQGTKYSQPAQPASYSHNKPVSKPAETVQKTKPAETTKPVEKAAPAVKPAEQPKAVVKKAEPAKKDNAKPEKKSKKNKKNKKNNTRPAESSAVGIPVHESEIAKTIAGEWVITAAGTTKISRDEDMPYINFVPAENRFYGSNGCNVLNGGFVVKGKTLIFKNVLSTMKYCAGNDFEQKINVVVCDDKPLTVLISRHKDRTVLTMSDAQGGQKVLTLTRHKMDFLNGYWFVTSINGKSINDEEANIFIDVNECKVHGNTGCNFFNGNIHIDPENPGNINFSGMAVTHMACEKGDQERNMLLALEDTSTARAQGHDIVILIDRHGREVLTLRRGEVPGMEK